MKRRALVFLLGALLALALGAAGLSAALTRLRAGPEGARAASAESFTLRGDVQQVAPDAWVVAGFPVLISPETRVTGEPREGADATIVGAIRSDGALEARDIRLAAPDAAAPMAAPTAAPELTATPLPEPSPTAPPAPTEAPPPTEAPAPTEPPAPPAEPLAALRALIEAGAADGRAGDAKDLLKRVDEAQRALDSGDAKRLRDRLRDLQRKTAELMRDGRMDASFGQQVLDGVATVAAAYGIDLSEPGPPGRGNDRGN